MIGQIPASIEFKQTVMIVIGISEEISGVTEYYALIFKRSHRIIGCHVTDLCNIKT